MYRYEKEIKKVFAAKDRERKRERWTDRETDRLRDSFTYII